MCRAFFMEIAIDGFSACGKSTLAKALAREIGAAYIDTGAMYRAVTLFFLENEVDYTSVEAVKAALLKIEITFDLSNGSNDCFLNGINVEDKIRRSLVSNQVSEVAALSMVRRKLVELQREMSKEEDVVMDGRDIGTVVFPEAKYKFFITADSAVRAQRRLDEYQEKGIGISRQEVVSNLEKRDHIDSTREDSPLKVAEDALVIDNSLMTREEQLQLVLDIIT
jgi:cytidylate kinase